MIPTHIPTYQLEECIMAGAYYEKIARINLTEGTIKVESWT